MEKKEKILKVLNEIFRKELNNDSLIIDFLSSPKNIEGWDSVTNLLLISSIEEKFNIQFSIDFIFEAENVGDFCGYILTNSTVEF